jgi:hypothetical protein
VKEVYLEAALAKEHPLNCEVRQLPRHHCTVAAEPHAVGAALVPLDTVTASRRGPAAVAPVHKLQQGAGRVRDSLETNVGALLGRKREGCSKPSCIWELHNGPAQTQ